MADTNEIELRTANRELSEPAPPLTVTTSASLINGQGVATEGRHHPSLDSGQVPGPSSETQGIDFFTWVSFRWSNDQELDELERHLQSRAANNPASQRLVNAYTRFKDQPSGKLFNDLLAFRTCNLDNVPASNYQSLEVEESNTFARCLSTLKDNLNTEHSISLRVCLLGNDVSKYIRSSGYSFASNLFVSKEILELRRSAPFLAILQVIQQEWQLSEEVIIDCKAPSPRLPKSALIGLPSEYSVQAFTLNSLNWQIISLQWLRDIKSFSQDLSVYVWQPHLEPLTTLSASIYVGPKATDSRPRNVLILLKCSNSIDRPLLLTARWLHGRAPSSIQQLSSTETEAISTILSLYSILTCDTCFLINSLLNEVEKLSTKGRRNPTVEKIHYTLYLSDCQKAASQALGDAIALLASISDYTGSQEDTYPSFDTWNEMIRKDLEYLQARLRDVDAKVAELRSLIKDQLDLRQIQIGRILAILAAVYLPFSFVSGFFGMNISDPLWNIPGNDSTPSHSNAASLKATTILGDILSNSNLSKLVNQTISGPNNSSTELPFFESEFDKIITAITSSGPHLFAFKTFLIVAFIITIGTIVLPLLAGAIFRAALQSIDRYKSYWRVLILVLGIATIVNTRVFLANYIYVIIFGVPQALLGVWKLYAAKIPVQENKRWIAYFALLVMSFTLDAILVDFAGFTGILPLIYLFFLGFVSDIRVFLRGRLPRLIQWIRIRKIKIAHYKYWIWALVLAWIGMNMALYFATNMNSSVTFGYVVFLFVYGVGKFWTAVKTREQTIQWLGFIFAVFGSFTMDIYLSAPIALAAVPFTYTILFRYLVNDQDFMKSYFPSWLVRRQRAVLPVSDTRDT